MRNEKEKKNSKDVGKLQDRLRIILILTVPVNKPSLFPQKEKRKKKETH